MTANKVDVFLAKLSICPCGFPILKEGIHIGAPYKIDPTRTEDMIVMCGGCGTKNELKGVWVYPRNPGGVGGFLPEMIFSKEDNVDRATKELLEVVRKYDLCAHICVADIGKTMALVYTDASWAVVDIDEHGSMTIKIPESDAMKEQAATSVGMLASLIQSMEISSGKMRECIEDVSRSGIKVQYIFKDLKPDNQ